MDQTTLLLLAAPLLLLDIGLKIAALVSLSRAERVRGGSKLLWVLVILGINLLGGPAWFLLGREEGA